MSISRNMRRKEHREAQKHVNVLAELLAGFYEFLESSPQPANDKVRSEFTLRNNKWKKYCAVNNLMNMSQLFIQNVQEAWKRYSTTEDR